MNDTGFDFDSVPGVTVNGMTPGQRAIAYYSYARGIMDGKGVLTIPGVAEMFALWAVENDEDGSIASNLWDDFLDIPEIVHFIEGTFIHG